MNSTVYLETSIIGYLASRPSRDLILLRQTGYDLTRASRLAPES